MTSNKKYASLDDLRCTSKLHAGYEFYQLSELFANQYQVIILILQIHEIANSGRNVHM